jgi:hypothetical protein
MHALDDLCLAAGREPASHGRLYSAGYAEKGIFSSTEATADWVGRLVEAGATELAFYLHEPEMEAFGRLAESGQFATRDSLSRLAEEVVPRYR